MEQDFRVGLRLDPAEEWFGVTLCQACGEAVMVAKGHGDGCQVSIVTGRALTDRVSQRHWKPLGTCLGLAVYKLSHPVTFFHHF